jgi:transcriptional regulator with XRE-family HTH domain
MCAMSTRPEQRPEGRLIGEAQKAAGISQRQAAARAGISENRWRNIVSGYTTPSAGVYVPSKGPADTVARMAQVVGVTPEQLEEAGRDDAAEVLRRLPPLVEAEREPTVAELAAQVAELQAAVNELLRRDQGKAG